MAVTQYDKSELITKLKGYKVVSTESGPIKPAKEQLIKAMTDGVMPPVGNQMSNEWDRRIYNERNPYFDGKSRKTVKDIMSEAASQTAAQGLRMDLSSIDAEQAHCKELVSRRGKDYVLDMYYPNTKGDLSIIIKDQFGNVKQVELAIDSDDYMNHLGDRILETIDSFDADRDVAPDLDTLLYNDLAESTPVPGPDSDGLNPEPGLFGEAVSWQLGRDMKETRRIMMEFGPDDFAVDDGAGDDVSADIAGAESADAGMNDPVPSPDAGSEVAGGEVEDAETYTNFATNHATILKNGTTDHMAEIIASSADETPVILGMDKQLNGFAGIKDMSDQAIINAFGKLFGFISDAPSYDDNRPAPETATDVRLPVAKWEELFTALDDEYTTPEHFKETIGKILPDMFDASGNMHNPAADLANLELPDEPGFQNTISADDKFSVAEPAPEGPASGADDVFGSIADDIARGEMEFQPDESTPEDDEQSRYDEIFQNVQ